MNNKSFMIAIIVTIFSFIFKAFMFDFDFDFGNRATDSHKTLLWQ